MPNLNRAVLYIRRLSKGKIANRCDWFRWDQIYGHSCLPACGAVSRHADMHLRPHGTTQNLVLRCCSSAAVDETDADNLEAIGEPDENLLEAALPVMSTEEWDLTNISPIHSLDFLALGRLQNFIKRHPRAVSGSERDDMKTTSLEKLCVVSGKFDDDTELFKLSSKRLDNAGILCRACVTFPLPKEISDDTLQGIGYALHAREAIHVASMHAERQLDALGIPVCGLRRTQIKYAEAKRASGLAAPFPNDPIKSLKDTTLPSPLRLIREHRLHEIQKLYIPVRYNSFYGNPHALVSPVNVDEFSVDRITAYCAHHRPQVKFSELCIKEVINSVEAKATRDKGFLGTAEKGDSTESVTAWIHITIRLPVPEKYGTRDVKGFAPHKKTALILACMHGELLLDTLGIPIFSNTEQQEKHAKVCEMYGRGAPRPGDEPAASSTIGPPALRTLFPGESIPVGDPKCVDSHLSKYRVSHITFLPEIQDVSSIDSSAMKKIQDYFITHGKVDMEQFYIEKIDGTDCNGVFKAVLALPIADNRHELAVGIANTAARAREVCAMHALTIIDHITKESHINVEDDARSQGLIRPPLRFSNGMDRIPSLLNFMRKELESTPVSSRTAVGSRKQRSRKLSSELQADSEEYILVPPEETIGREASEIVALTSPRKFDAFSVERINDYLRRHGTSPEFATNVENIGDLSSSQFYRVKIFLPTPPGYGPRVGIGEAPKKQEANILAHMHCELILDHLGIPLFDHEVLQKKHAMAARKHKRFAPTPADVGSSFSTPSPPPLRKERNDSMKWLRFLREKFESHSIDISASHVQTAQTSTWDYVGPKELDYDAKLKLYHHIVTHPKNRNVTTLDNRFEVSRNGESGASYYYCKMKIDVPEHRGKIAEARGSAVTQRDAEMLCCMHALRILDAYGMRVFFIKGMQDRHAKQVRKAGRWARFSTEPPPPASDNISFPKALRIDAAGPKPKPPPTPSICDDGVWNAFVDEVATYLHEQEEWDLCRCLLRNKIPEVGDKLIDETLLAVENRALDMHARTKINNYCIVRGYEAPAFDYKDVGKRESQFYFASTNIPGFSGLQAFGIGSSKDESTRRCAMHCLEVLSKLDPSITGLDLLRTANWDSRNNVDRNVQVMQEEGRHRVVELYCLSRGLELPSFEISARNVATGRMYSVSSTLGEFTARAENPMHQPALNQCLSIMMNKMVKYDPAFRELQTFLRSHPFLDTYTVLDLKLSQDLLRRMNALSEVVFTSVELSKSANDSRKSDASGTDFSKHREIWHVDAETRARRNEKLLNEKRERESDEQYQEHFGRKRCSLPIFKFRDEIIKLLYEQGHNVVVLCGTTGCGKTTQVPQYILDYHIEKGEGAFCTMLVTQPRRISAVSIPKRIASERTEICGDNIGFIVRLDALPGKHVTFVTSGVLLRILKDNPMLEGFSHVIVDEIHERDINSDFLLILLRDLLGKRTDLKVVLMSATLQAKLFSDYFGGAPVLEAEGGVFPVEMHYLEDIAKVAKQYGFSSPFIQANDTGEDIFTANLDYSVIAFVVSHLMETKKDEMLGYSILIFLPGWEEIVQAKTILSSGAGGDPSQFTFVTLHSAVSAADQALCFRAADSTKTKIILSTNIAESGVTIDDIKVVIDAGRMKEKSFIHTEGRSQIAKETGEMGAYAQLVTVPASRANCVQRRGRAGRTRGGICYRIYSKAHFEALDDFQTPELLRQPLDSLCLSILHLKLGDPNTVLSKALECPTIESVDFALQRLEQLGAIKKNIAEDTVLTPLGEVMAVLPVSPHMAKALVYGTMFRCLDSILTIAAASQQNLFMGSKDKRQDVKRSKLQFELGTHSDHLTALNAFNAWVARRRASVEINDKNKLIALSQFEDNLELNSIALLQVAKYKKQFAELIFRVVLQCAPPEEGCRRGDCFVEDTTLSEHAGNISLVKAVLGTALYPNFAVHREKRKTFRGKHDNMMVLASNSVLCQAKEFGSRSRTPYVIFDEKQRLQYSETKSLISFRNATALNMLSVVILGAPAEELEYREDIKLGLLGDWMPFRCEENSDMLEVIKRFKKALDTAVNLGIQFPRNTQYQKFIKEFRQLIIEAIQDEVVVNSLISDNWAEKGKILCPTDQTDFEIREIADSELEEPQIQEKDSRAPIFRNTVLKYDDGSVRSIAETTFEGESVNGRAQAPRNPFHSPSEEETSKSDLVELILHYYPEAKQPEKIITYKTTQSQEYEWNERPLYESTATLNAKIVLTKTGHLRANRSAAEKSAAFAVLRAARNDKKYYFGHTEIQREKRVRRRANMLPDLEVCKSAKSALMEFITRNPPKDMDLRSALFFQTKQKEDLKFESFCYLLGHKHVSQRLDQRRKAEADAALIAYNSLKADPRKYLGEDFAEETGDNVKRYDQDGFEIQEEYASHGAENSPNEWC